MLAGQAMHVRVDGSWRVGRILGVSHGRVIVSYWRVRPTADGLKAVEAVTSVPRGCVRTPQWRERIWTGN